LTTQVTILAVVAVMIVLLTGAVRTWPVGQLGATDARRRHINRATKPHCVLKREGIKWDSLWH
jgi:hypothetical protein